MLFTSLLEKLSKTKVLVIGDLMLDHYIWGDVHRISPEAPVPVVYVKDDTYTCGGAANVAVNLANLGVKTSVIGHCAADEAGKRLSDIMNDFGINLIKSDKDSPAPTIIKTRVIVRNQQLCRIDREAEREKYNPAGNSEFKAMLLEAISDADAVIISDYAKGVITQSLVDSILKISKDRPHLLVAIDPKPSRGLQFTNVGVLTPNRSEALELAGLTEQHFKEEYPLNEVSRRIQEKYQPKLLIITLGADGMGICKEGYVVKHLPTRAREVFDVSGAGDTVIATLTAALAAGADAVEAAQLANAAAGCVVAHMGTSPIKLSELRLAIEELG